jgi:hypothetical protein
MSVAEPAGTNGDGVTDEAAREAARDIWQAARAAGESMSGAELGRAFGKTDRWGRKQIEHARRSAGERNGTAGTASRPGPDAAVGRNGPGPAGTLRAVPADSRDDPEPAPEDERSWLDSVIILVVAGVASVASYGHMLEVAMWAGEPLWIARAFPITVDGLVLAALRRGRQGRWWLALGIAVSVAANMLARYPDLAATAGPVVSAWPPLALFGTHRLLHGARHRGDRS